MTPPNPPNLQNPPHPSFRKDAELVIPNPNLKLMDQVREVLRIRQRAIRTESCYCDWIHRYIRFHKMRSREDLLSGVAKVQIPGSRFALQPSSIRAPLSSPHASPLHRSTLRASA